MIKTVCLHELIQLALILYHHNLVEFTGLFILKSRDLFSVTDRSPDDGLFLFGIVSVF